MPPKNKNDSNHLFQGLRFTFLVKSHAKLMMKRIQEYGGALDDTVTSATTHIVCRPEMPGEKIIEALPPEAQNLDHYHLVTQNFVAQSIIKDALQDETAFRPVLIDTIKKRKDAPSSGTTPMKLSQSFPSNSPPTKRIKPSSPAEAIPTPSIVPNSGRSPAEQNAVQPHESSKEVEEEESEDGLSKEPCVVERRGSEWVAIRGRKPKVTGGSTGIPWGSFAVWDEPFDPGASRNTIEKLRKYWYVTRDPSKIHNGGEKEENLPAGGSREVSAEPQPKSGNGVCSHVACSLRPYCFIRRLEDVKKIYLEGRDQFKIKVSRIR